MHAAESDIPGYFANGLSAVGEGGAISYDQRRLHNILGAKAWPLHAEIPALTPFAILRG